MNRTLLAFMLVLSSVASAQVELSGYNYLAEGDSTVFYVSDESMDWHSAHAAAELAGGHLATFASIEENLSVLAELGAEGVWLGLLQDSLGLEPEGGWRWSGEGPVVFTNWDDSDPNDSNGGEDCGSGIGFFGSWQDQGCHLSFRYVLEVQTVVFGCTDSSACNYDPDANEDDGSCLSVDLGEDIETCEDSVTLDAGDGFGSYLWSTGETSQTITVSESGLYEAQVSAHPANKWSLSFDGNDDYVEVPDDESLALDDFSVSFAIKTSASVAALIQKDANPEPIGGDWNIAMWEGQITVNVRKQSGPESGYAILESLEPINDEVWHTVCMTRNSLSGVVALWVDGALNQEGQGPIGTVSNNMDINFGRQNFNYTDYFNGWLDDISVWDVVLSPEQIQQISNCSVVGLESELVGHWSFEEGAEGTAYDSSENENDGNIHGASWSEEVPEQDCSSCEYSDEILVDFDDCDAYCGEGTVWDPFNQECIVAIPTDTDFDGCVAAGDLLNLLGTFGSCPPIPFSGPCQGQDHVTYQGYHYDIAAIGDQCWFAENLRAKNYRNGDVVPSNHSNSDWSSLSTGAFSTYGANETCNNISPTIDSCDPLVAEEVYGLLYNWYTVNDSRGICPIGWHAPTDSDWTTLSDDLGGAVEAGEKIKSSEGWCDGCEGTNSSGFNGLASGRRSVEGVSSTAAGITYENAGGSCQWWSASSAEENESANAISRGCDGNSVFNVDVHDSRFGFSIRCIKDQ